MTGRTAPALTGSEQQTRRTGSAEQLAAVRQVAGVRRAGRRRERAVVTGLLLAVLAAACVALSVGDIVLPVPDILATLTGNGDPAGEFVIIDLRLPRVLTGLLVGLAFGTSGAVFQTLLRNPLASPDVIGISSGAGAAAVLAALGFGASGFVLSGSALAGALVTAAAIYVLAWRRGVAGYRLVLVGIGVGAGLSGVISFLMTRSEVTEAQEALRWLTGSLNDSSWEQVWPLLAALAVLGPLTSAAARLLPALQLGDDAASGLGARVERGRLALLACAVALAGAATAAAGPVGFVAFVSPPIARRLVPGRGAALLPSALTGALLVLAADFAAQHLLWSQQFPVGVVTSLVGAPYLLWLLARANSGGSGG